MFIRGTAGCTFFIRTLKKAMGRSYWFECSKCGYRTKVSGKGDRGLNFFVQTILCRDCKELYDAVTRLRVVEPRAQKNLSALSKASKERLTLRVAPGFMAALNRLPLAGSNRLKWLDFKPKCPVSTLHRVQAWNEPGRCPRCGAYLERNAVPYRVWD